MRVDNGEPFGSPTGFAPPPLGLWLIGQGVKMIWNKPRCPKQNAKVEKLQDTTSRWAEVENCKDIPELQQRLDEQVRLQRQRYPVSRLGGKTRLEAYPGLLTGKRPYRSEDFQLQRVWAFFRSCVFTRKVSCCGVLTHFKQQTCIGRAYKSQWAQVRLSEDGQNWEVFVGDKLVKTYADTCLSKERIESLCVYQNLKKQKDQT